MATKSAKKSTGSKSSSTKNTEREVHNYDGLATSLRKSDKGKIKLSVAKFGDTDHLDIRHMYESKEGEWLPTRKGCAVPLELAEKLHVKLGKLIAKAKKAGLQVGTE